MKIAQLTECLTDNGVSTVVRNLTAGFREAGHQVDIITWRESSFNDPALRRVALPGLSDDRLSIVQRLLLRFSGERLWLYLQSPRIVRELLAQVDLEEYDAVLVHGLACIPLWRLPQRCFIVAHSTKSKMLLRSRQLLLRPLLRRLYGRIYRNHPVVCVSQGARQDLIDSFGVDPQRVTAIYNPFPIGEIRRKAQESIDDVPAEYLLAVGRPVKSKRFDRLMRVYKMSGIDAPLVVLVGSGKAAKVKKLAERYGVAGRVITIGYRQNPYPYMARAKLLVLTSDYEGLPTVLIESLICGTPVVSTDCPSGPREILKSSFRAGLVETANEQEFGTRLRQVFRSPYFVAKDGLVEFSIDRTVALYLEFICRQG